MLLRPSYYRRAVDLVRMALSGASARTAKADR